MKHTAAMALLLISLCCCAEKELGEDEQFLADVASFARDSSSEESRAALLKAEAERLGLESRAVSILLVGLARRVPEFRGDWHESPLWRMDAQAHRILGLCTALGDEGIAPVFKFLITRLGPLDGSFWSMAGGAEKRDPGTTPRDPLSFGSWGAAEGRTLMSMIADRSVEYVAEHALPARNSQSENVNMFRLALHAVGLVSHEGQLAVVDECAALLHDRALDHRVWGSCQAVLMQVGPEALPVMMGMLRKPADDAAGWVARPFVVFGLSDVAPDSPERRAGTALAVAEEVAQRGGIASWIVGLALLKLDNDSAPGRTAIRAGLLEGDAGLLVSRVEELMWSEHVKNRVVWETLEDLLKLRVLPEKTRKELRRALDVQK